MSQRQQLERILEIDRQIRAGLYPNADSLAAELEVSRRVIFNDRQFLIDRLGAPLQHDRKHGGWYYAEENWPLPAVMMTEGELLAFFLSVEVAQRYLGTSCEAPLRSAVEKIARSLQGRAAVSLELLHRHFTFAPPAAAPTNEEALVALHEAIAQGRVIQMRYHTASRRQSSDRLVHPHHLVHQGGEWYLIAFDRRRAKMLTFNVARIEKWHLLDERFTRQADFDPRAWQRAAFGAETQSGVVTIAVRFSPDEAVYIGERRWHETQRLEDLPDGGVILRLQKRWIMGYGAHAEVLEPVTLRDEIQNEVRAMKTMYGGHDE
jgi:predicted DNA-binding transcriptional regulator YafY